MKIVANSPKRSSWRLTTVTFPDGGVVVCPDNTPDAPATRAVAGADGRIAAVPNVVVEARLRAQAIWRGRSSVNVVFAERDGGPPLHTSPDGALAIFGALQDGRLRMDDGWITGRFTFRKIGAGVYVWPLEDGIDGAAASPVPEGAPDLSDFVRTLERGA